MLSYIFPCLLFWAVLFLIYKIPLFNDVLHPADDFVPLSDDISQKNNKLKKSDSLSDIVFNDKSILMGLILGLFYIVIPKSVRQRALSHKPLKTFINSQSDFIYFYDRKTEISKLIVGLVFLLFFGIFCALFVMVIFADTYDSIGHPDLDWGLLELLQKIFLSGNFDNVLSAKDQNLMFLMGGLCFVATYYWLLFATEIFILRKNYRMMSIVGKTGAAIFAVLPAVLCCILPAAGLKFVAFFICLCGFIVSIRHAEINKIKAKLQKEYGLSA